MFVAIWRKNLQGGSSIGVFFFEANTYFGEDTLLPFYIKDWKMRKKLRLLLLLHFSGCSESNLSGLSDLGMTLPPAPTEATNHRQ